MKTLNEDKNKVERKTPKSTLRLLPTNNGAKYCVSNIDYVYMVYFRKSITGNVFYVYEDETLKKTFVTILPQNANFHCKNPTTNGIESSE